MRATVLTREEASRKDELLTPRPTFSNDSVATALPCVPTSTNESNVIDLYSAGHIITTKDQTEGGEAVPFIHQIILEGLHGEKVRVRALFDDGAMVGAMCTSIYHRVKHRLHNWQKSHRRLRMANGNIVTSEAKWSGTIEIDGVRANGDFEVFNSGGGWGFLFGKPLLQAFAAIHDYTPDAVAIASKSHAATIHNEVYHPTALEHVTKGVSLTQDNKQWEIAAGGTEIPPSRQVSSIEYHDAATQTDDICENVSTTQGTIAPLSPMGQWKPNAISPQQRERKRVRQMWKRIGHLKDEEEEDKEEDKRRSQAKGTTREHIALGSEQLPSREVQMKEQQSSQRSTDHINHADQTTGICIIIEQETPKDLSEPVPTTRQPTLYTRQTDPHNPARTAEIIRQIAFGDDLSPEELMELEKFIIEYADTFALALKEVIPIPGSELNLNVPENTTFNLRINQRPLTPEQSRFYNDRINDMLEAGLVERAPPELIRCTATTVITQKAHEAGGLPWEELKQRINDQYKDAGMPPAFELEPQEVTVPPSTRMDNGPRKWRVCQNFAQLNKVTEIAPMPQGDILAKQQRLSGHRYISVFDFAAGFYAIEVPEKWRPYLAFYVEGRGYFWYKRMPMGYTGAPTVFCDTLATRLHDFLVTYYMELFMDDGACAANTFREMMNKLTILFKRFRECNFSIAPSKTRLCMTEIEFAGGTVGKDGVKPDLTKLTAIVDWPQPENAMNLASFLGLTGFYRMLIKAYAKREGPLRDLLLKVPLEDINSKTAYRRAMSTFQLSPHWKPEHTRAFLDLKTAITSRPVLQAPRYDGSHFVITTDGCIDGFAAVLSQRVRTQTATDRWVEHLHPIGFASKRTSQVERKYKSYLLEFAALKFGLDKFSSIIWGFPVEIETDCSAMKDTLLNPKLNAAHARWREGIMSYHIVDVRHVPGKLNVVADGLSRKGEGKPNTLGDGSEWTVSEDWEARLGLVNDIMHITHIADPSIESLRSRFEKEPIFLEVIDAIHDLDQSKDIREKRRARHRASQYIIEEGKLWRLRGGTTTRARAKVECISKEEAKTLAATTHAEGGHWGRDAIKIALLDRICSPKLDASILEAVKNCAKCKGFGPTHLHSLLEPITRRHPFELLVGDYLTLPKGKGSYSTLGVYLDTFSQHVWVYKYKTAGSAKTTIDSLNNIFNAFTSPETFMADGGKHFNNDAVRTFCEAQKCKLHTVAAYSPWVNGLVEGTNKLLLHVLKRLCAPPIGEDNQPEDEVSWDKLPKSWPDHLDNAVYALNHRLLPALKFSPKELLLGLIVNTPPTPIEEGTSILKQPDVTTQIAYVEQQRLDGYEETVRHAIKRKAAFDKKLLQRAPREVTFKAGQLVQVYRNDLDYTFKAERKLIPKWSIPHRIHSRILNSYKLETLRGKPLRGEFSARRLRAFCPREGTKLAEEQRIHENGLREKAESREGEENATEENIEGKQRETESKDNEEELEDGGSDEED